MSADKSQILADITALLRPLTDNLLPGEDLTMETRIIEDLGLESIHLANLSGRIQSKYGAATNLVPFFAGRELAPLTDLRIGELVDYIASVMDEAEARAAGTVAPGNSEDSEQQRVTEIMRHLMFDDLDPNGSVQNAPIAADSDNAAVGSDNAGPGPVLPPANGRRQGNDNAAVLAEHVPGITRSVLSLPRGNVEVFTAGDGPTLLLMHPINIGAGVFARLFASLASEYRVVCVHHPGVGATTWSADMSIPGIARLYRTVLAELSVTSPFHVVGSSFGGQVAQQFALLHPEECASLVLFGCSYRAGGSMAGVRQFPAIVQREFDRVYSATGNAPEGSRAELEELLLRCEGMNAGLGMSYLEAFRSRPSLLGRLPDITTPTLILRGRHDTIAQEKDAHVLYGAIPGAQFTELPGAGHFPYLTHPAEVGEILAPFLAAHASPVPASPVPARGGLVASASAPAMPTAFAAPAQSEGRGPQAARATAKTRAAAPAAPAETYVPPRPPEQCGIVISSGRCGSTLLSELIHEEPETLSAFEALAPIRGRLLLTPLTELTGAQFWELCAEPSPQGRVLAKTGTKPKEFAYPDYGRWANDIEGLPPILYVTLPQMTADPDGLFDQLAEKVPQFPTQTAGQHLRMSLDLIAHLQGKRRWVERSGASSMNAYPWITACLDANIVYLTRNIEDTARSMSKHPSFQFSAIRHQFHVRYGADPYSKRLERWLPDSTELPEDLQRLMPDQLNAETLRDMDIDMSIYERMVAHMHGSAEQALDDLQPKRLHRIQYEDLQANPKEELTKLGSFLGFSDPAGWAERNAHRVNPPRVRAAEPA